MADVSSPAARPPIAGHVLAAISALAALAVLAVIFVLTPFDPVGGDLRLRDDDAVLVIRTFALGAIALATVAAFLASIPRSFNARPKLTIGILLVATATVLAAVLRIFETIGI